MKLFIIALAFIAVADCVNGQSCTATRTNGGKGICINIYKCPSLIRLVNNQNRSSADVDMLRRSACGFEGNTPKVCCPLLESSKKDGCESKVTAFPPDPSSGCCGVDDEYVNKLTIGGGVDAEIYHYPWLTLIEYVDRNKRIKLMCGGALISTKYVLTAAHCIAGSILDYGTPKNVRLGEYDTDHDGPDCKLPIGAAKGEEEECTDEIVVIPIEKTIPHAEYNPLTKKHDIGLIRMHQAAPYTSFIRPICMPAIDITVTPPPHFTLFAAGWGAINYTHSRSAIKQYVELPFVSQTICQSAYNVTRRQVSLWRGQICAGGEIGKDSCKGDSGGPLMYANLKYFEVLGVVNFGPNPCGMKDVPGVYSKVIEYVGWINSHIVE